MSKKDLPKNKISNLIAIGILVVLTVALLLSSNFISKKQTTDTRAAGGCLLVDGIDGEPEFISANNHFGPTDLPVCQIRTKENFVTDFVAIIQDNDPNDGGADDILIAGQDDPKGSNLPKLDISRFGR